MPSENLKDETFSKLVNKTCVSSALPLYKNLFHENISHSLMGHPGVAILLSLSAVHSIDGSGLFPRLHHRSPFLRTTAYGAISPGKVFDTRVHSQILK